MAGILRIPPQVVFLNGDDITTLSRAKVVEQICYMPQDTSSNAALTVFDMAMHNLNLAVRYTGKIALLHNGSIATVDTPEQVITEENMKRVYQIESHVERKRGIVNVEALRSCTADPALAEQLRGLFPG